MTTKTAPTNVPASTLELRPEAWQAKCRAEMRRVADWADFDNEAIDAMIGSIADSDDTQGDWAVTFAAVHAFVDEKLADIDANVPPPPEGSNLPVPALQGYSPASPGANLPALANLSRLARFAGQDHNLKTADPRQPVLNWRNGGQNYQTDQWRKLPRAMFDSGKLPVSYLDVFGGFTVSKRHTEFPIGNLVAYNPRGNRNNGDEVEFLYDVSRGGIVYVCFITHRLDYRHQEADGRYTPLLHYEEGSKPWFRAWVLIKGAEDWHLENGPLLLSVNKTNAYRFRDLLEIKKGPNKGQAARQKMLVEAERIGGVRPPDYAFWLPVRPGEPELVGKGEQSFVTPPVTDVSELPAESDLGLDVLTLPDEMLDLCAERWDELRAWATEPLANQIKDIEAWDAANQPSTNGDGAPPDTDVPF